VFRGVYQILLEDEDKLCLLLRKTIQKMKREVVYFFDWKISHSLQTRNSENTIDEMGLGTFPIHDILPTILATPTRPSVALLLHLLTATTLAFNKLKQNVEAISNNKINFNNV